MISQDKLTCFWGVWLSYSSGNTKNQQAKYNSNLDKIYSLDNWADFLYVWKVSNINDPSNYFIDPQTGKYLKYQINGQLKKIQSINFFKKDIEPKWQYGDNSKGGYFNFSIPKQLATDKIQQVYQNFVFMAIGSTFKVCEHINGIRIVDTTMKNSFQCRFEIWVDYQDQDQNLILLKQHGEQLGSVLKKLQLNTVTMKFFNIGSKATLKKNEQHEKVEKNGHY